MNDSFNDTRDEVPCLNLKNVRKCFRCRDVGGLQESCRAFFGEKVEVSVVNK